MFGGFSQTNCYRNRSTLSNMFNSTHNNILACLDVLSFNFPKHIYTVYTDFGIKYKTFFVKCINKHSIRPDKFNDIKYLNCNT